MELKQIFTVIRKRIWMIVAIVVASCLIVGTYSVFLAAPTYEASTKLIVNHNERYSNGMQAVDWNTVNTNIMLMNSYKEIIRSEAILNQVAELHPEFGMTGKMLAKYITAKSTPNSQIMSVYVYDGSYERAVSIANAIAEVFKTQIPGIMKVDNVAILSFADPNEIPFQVSPNTPLNLILAFFVMTMLAVGLAFLIEYMDDTIKTEADGEKILGLPTLSLVYAMRRDDFAPRTNRKTGYSKPQLSEGEKSYVPLN